ncbi:Uncharacterised protein [Mycobacteroides abscessus subsp. abscessus]|nr:Uncharacterised protein [Mycobacteroides abscessus subsp. abscessus]
MPTTEFTVSRSSASITTVRSDAVCSNSHRAPVAGLVVSMTTVVAASGPDTSTVAPKPSTVGMIGMTPP